MNGFTHIDKNGNLKMVDVGEKAVTRRTAKAHCRVLMKQATLKAITEDRIEKGNVFAVSQLAGIMAAKRVGELIPLCHALFPDQVTVSFSPDIQRGVLEITGTVLVHAKTGAEMEALLSVSTAALTVYDMCKAVDRGMRVMDLELLEKEGGKSGRWRKK
jgi:cyclic pyranopterin phosphate synthase